ncbi:MAG: hypothetical protein WBD40_20765 [Tepidisphaeraceae bacterium]
MTEARGCATLLDRLTDMATLDFETDPTLTLLTDALRAGPGTPLWRDAVSKLREQGGDQADEYLLLCTAREHLASGKSYKEIHAGPGFSRKVMEAVEQERNGATRAAPTAGFIAMISAAVVIGVVGIAGYFLWRSSGAAAPPPTDLSQIHFTETVLDVPLNAAPAGWKTIGALPMKFEKGLRPDAAPTVADQEYAGGALLWSEPIAPGQAAQVEVDVRLPSPESKVVAQVFVTDDPALSETRATSPSELVWSYRNGEASVVLPTGRLDVETFKPGAKQQRLDVRIQFDGRSAAVDTGGKRLWSGEHGLNTTKPRYVGLRFLAPAGEPPDGAAAFASISVKKPQTP